MFLAAGSCPLARYREAGLRIGLGSDVAGAPDLSIFRADARRLLSSRTPLTMVAGSGPPASDTLDWLRLGTLGGAEALGLDEVTGSLEAGKEADLIASTRRIARSGHRAATDDDPTSSSAA